MSIPRRIRRFDQIWCHSVQPFNSFPRLLHLWPPNPPPNASLVIKGQLGFILCPFPDESADITKVGANRTASPDFWIVDPLNPPPPSAPLCLESQFAWRISIPRWICRYVPNVVTICPAVWQLPHTFECLTSKPPPQVPPLCLEGNLFGVYPFPGGSAYMWQIWCKSVQPFDCFPRLLNFWHPNLPTPQMPPGILRGDLYIAYVHSYMNPQAWTKIGANRTAFPECWIVDPLKNPKCVSRDNLIGVYPYEFAHVCQPWCQSAQPFGGFSRICAKGSSAFRRWKRWLAQKHAKNNIYTSKIIIPARTCREQPHYLSSQQFS